MSNVKPISDLRNYNSVLKDCSPGSPVYLTKNGRGKYVVVDIEEYERNQAEIQLLNELEKGKSSDTWYTVDELRKELGL